ncbi:peptidoglycan-binding like protein precursor [Escherichia coli]|nr:lytic transglycosylase domain-containing protein [Escherichia coli]GCJ09603.1 peptidoglycan-binding like protein precursor [Escherichia coli]
MFRIEPNLIKAIALVESNLKKDSIGKNRDKNNNIKSLDYWLMQINQMHIPLLKKRGIIKDERDLLDNPCLNIKIGTEILYNHFSRCGVTWQCLGTYNAGFAMDNQKKRQQYAPKYILYIPGLMNQTIVRLQQNEPKASFFYIVQTPIRKAVLINSIPL